MNEEENEVKIKSKDGKVIFTVTTFYDDRGACMKRICMADAIDRLEK